MSSPGEQAMGQRPGTGTHCAGCANRNSTTPQRNGALSPPQPGHSAGARATVAKTQTRARRST